MENKPDYKIVLAGNPNVGKSTLFNALTGMNQHTGNWTGKTVEYALGSFFYKDKVYQIADLPGSYSLLSYSEEEKVTRDYLKNGDCDCTIITLDSTVPERSLRFALEVLSIQKKVIVCLNMTDECEKNGVIVDEKELSKQLGVPVIKTSAVKGEGISRLKDTLESVCGGKVRLSPSDYNIDVSSDEKHTENVKKLSKICRDICSKCVLTRENKRSAGQRKLDTILTSKRFGIPIMLALIALLFWITLVGANYPSEWLGRLFALIKEFFESCFTALHIPEFWRGLLLDGVYTTLSWVVSVMLPPMAIFFPMFSLIEESGYLPRIAFNTDTAFSKCGSHGKQCLTMMMGIGCNACGVEGCRIIENKKERLIAILTNSFMPCNGRFPILIAIILIFFAGSAFNAVGSIKAALLLLLIIVICVALTLAVSKVLSKAIKGDASSGFILELPPYRKPQILKTIYRSLIDKALKVLGRAVIVAAPAGAVIWLMANITVGDCSVLQHCTRFFEPFGRFIGLDGVIVIAFILGFPANETVIPIMIMAYTQSSVMTDYTGYAELSSLLYSNGWSVLTAVCMIIITVLHFPCSTTCLTIHKETKSVKWTLLGMILPTALGVAICALVSVMYRAF